MVRVKGFVLFVLFVKVLGELPGRLSVINVYTFGGFANMV